MKVSRAGFYKWVNYKDSKRKVEDKVLKKAITKIYESSRCTYGRRRVLATLRKQGFVCGHKRVSRLMRNLGIAGIKKRAFKKTTNSNHKKPVCPNLVVQDFEASIPKELFLSDITYVPTKQGWLYLCTIIDAYSRRIVGWSMSESLTKEIVVDSVTMALSELKDISGTVFHSDRGSQYASKVVRHLLASSGFHQSMSSSGNCFDNAMAESLFATIKKELVHRCNFSTR